MPAPFFRFFLLAFHASRQMPVLVFFLFIAFCKTLPAQTNCDSLLTLLYVFSGNADDQSGNGHHGITQGVAGMNGQLNIPRDTSSAIIVPSEAINGALDFTFSLRVRFDLFHLENTVNGYTPTNHIVSGFSDNNAFNFGYKKMGNELRFTLEGVHNDIPLQIELEEKTWYCIAVTRTGNIVRVFVDGEQVSNDIFIPATPVDILPGGFVLGQDQDCLAGCYEFNHSLAGSIDNLRIYRRALAFDEIYALCETTETTANICPGQNYAGHISTGIYEDNFITENGCDSTRIIDLRVSGLEIFSITKNAARCTAADGSLHIEAGNGAGPLTYSMNGLDFQDNGFFQHIAAGEYLVFVQDSFACVDSQIVEIERVNDLFFQKLILGTSSCQVGSGTAQAVGAGGNPSYGYSLDSVHFQPEGFFENMEAGTYTIFLKDQNGCLADSTFMVGQDRCPIYVPNVFSPNNDGINDAFQIFPNPAFGGEIISLSIFDRWGGNVFFQNNIMPFSFTGWWDGTWRGEECGAGVYVYFLKIKYADGKEEIMEGSIMLAR